MKRIFTFLIVIIVGIVLIWALLMPKYEGNNIVYSWSMDALDDTDFINLLNKYKITTVYQDFSSEYLNNKDNSFIKNLNNQGINVFHLCGEPEWGTDKLAKDMKDEIDKIYNYNNNVQNDIEGIVFDVETYSIKDEKFDFALFVKSMKEAYKYAKKKNLKMIIAIPVWLDSKDKELLEDLVKNGCDGIALMNYNIKYTKENMEFEVSLAKKYDKDIETIYEIEFDDENYFSSYTAIEKDYDIIKKNYSYSKLRKAYHHYGKIKQYHE